jgi:hypothetical protein
MLLPAVREFMPVEEANNWSNVFSFVTFFIASVPELTSISRAFADRDIFAFGQTAKLSPKA